MVPGVLTRRAGHIRSNLEMESRMLLYQQMTLCWNKCSTYRSLDASSVLPFLAENSNVCRSEASLECLASFRVRYKNECGPANLTDLCVCRHTCLYGLCESSSSHCASKAGTWSTKLPSLLQVLNLLKKSVKFLCAFLCWVNLKYNHKFSSLWTSIVLYYSCKITFSLNLEGSP